MWLPEKYPTLVQTATHSAAPIALKTRNRVQSQTADAGDDAVRLAQALDEARDDDDLAAVAVEEARGLLQTLGRQEDVAAVPFGERTAAEVADREADVVAKQRAKEAQQGDEHDAEPTGARIDGGQDQDGLARDGHAEVLDQHQADDGEITVVVQGGLERVQYTRQMLGHGGVFRSAVGQVAEQPRKLDFRGPSLETTLQRGADPALRLGSAHELGEQIGVATEVVDGRQRERPIDPAVTLSKVGIVVSRAQHHLERACTAHQTREVLGGPFVVHRDRLVRHHGGECRLDFDHVAPVDTLVCP